MRAFQKKIENRAYPSVDGLPASPDSLWLPESSLSLEKDKNYTVHHGCWTARHFGEYALYKTLRDLESQQYRLPRDIHNYIHRTYSSPKLPTPEHALLEIQRAARDGERLSFRKGGKHVICKIGAEVMKKVHMSYEDLQKRRHNKWDEKLSFLPEDLAPIYEYPEDNWGNRIK
ncbi:MAG: hypothetical protein WA087_00685 [Candidatus Saccharimonadales bacterium]